VLPQAKIWLKFAALLTNCKPDFCMAFIGTLRNKLTKVVVGAVLIALAAFIVGSDLLTPGSSNSLFGNDDNVVGEIGGHEVSLEEYQAAVNEIEANYIMGTNRRPTEAEQPAIRNQAWDLLIARYAINPEFEKVGVTVTDDELVDIIQGKNIDDNIKNSFRDSLGNFDRKQLNNFISQTKALKMGDPRRVQWDMFQRNLAPARERLKYENLLLKTGYVTQAEAEREYHAQTDVAEIKYLYVPFYYAGADSSITVTDAQVRAYYEKNKNRYKTEASRSMSYVTIPVVASTEDSAAYRKNLDALVEGFKTTQNDSLYALNNSTNENAFATYNASNLPETISNQLDALTPGVVVGPYLEGGSYKLIKMVRIASDTNYFARASNILITWDDPSDAGKKAAKDKARKVLSEIKAGALFASKAFEYNNDATKTKGGDLGWFGKGAMVKPFEDAVFKATRKGLVNDIIETNYGYHLIDVTGLKNNTTYTVAVIEEEIVPSEATRNQAFRKADAFANGLEGVESFKERAKKENLAVNDAKSLGPNDRRVSNLGDARNLVSWLFRDGKIGKVSAVETVDETYVVAVMTEAIEKGFKPFEAVKEEVTPLAKNEAIATAIIAKLAGKTEPLETLAEQFGRDAIVNSSNDLKLSASSMVSVGPDAAAVGKAFSLENGGRSKPFKGENGVLVIEMKAKTIAPAIADYSSYKLQLNNQAGSRGSYAIGEALKEVAKIEDNRYKFF
jgi:peptidyl-prolyl cis-trans isomerase D